MREAGGCYSIWHFASILSGQFYFDYGKSHGILTTDVCGNHREVSVVRIRCQENIREEKIYELSCGTNRHAPT